MPFKSRTGVRRRKTAVPLNKAILRDMERKFKEAGREYVRAAVEHVPVDSGMSVSTYTPLATHLRIGPTVARAASGGSPKAGHKSNYGYPIPNNVAPFKSKAFGARLGKRGYSMTYGTLSSPTFWFNFSITALQHFVRDGLHDEWGSLVAGELAFKNYLTEQLYKGTPLINEWLVNGRIVRGSG